MIAKKRRALTLIPVDSDRFLIVRQRHRVKLMFLHTHATAEIETKVDTCAWDSMWVALAHWVLSELCFFCNW